MADIVLLLRAYTATDGNAPPGYQLAAKTMREAADEIERLRGVVDRAKAMLRNWSPEYVAELDAMLGAESPASERRDDAEAMCRLLASIWFYGNWRWETPNERDLQAILERRGWWPITEDALIAKARATDQPSVGLCRHGKRMDTEPCSACDVTGGKETVQRAAPWVKCGCEHFGNGIYRCLREPGAMCRTRGTIQPGERQ